MKGHLDLVALAVVVACYLVLLHVLDGAAAGAVLLAGGSGARLLAVLGTVLLVTLRFLLIVLGPAYVVTRMLLRVLPERATRPPARPGLSSRAERGIFLRDGR